MRIVLIAIARRRRAGAVARGAAVDRPASPTCSRSARASSRAYDVGHLGRFGRHCSARCSRSTRRSASGRCSSTRSFPRTRTTPISTRFMSGGWLSGVRLPDAGVDDAGPRLALRVRRRRPGSRPISRSTAPSSASRPKACIIDSDHWRHYFLLLGVLWGLMAVTRPSVAARICSTRATASRARHLHRLPGRRSCRLGGA